MVITVGYLPIVLPMLLPGVSVNPAQIARSLVLLSRFIWGPLRYLCGAALLPAVYCLAVYAPVWLTGAGQFDGSVLGRVFPLLPFALAEGLVFALGEEIGWRGFLAPTFHRTRGFGWPTTLSTASSPPRRGGASRCLRPIDRAPRLWCHAHRGVQRRKSHDRRSRGQASRSRIVRTAARPSRTFACLTDSIALPETKERTAKRYGVVGVNLTATRS